MKTNESTLKKYKVTTNVIFDDRQSYFPKNSTEDYIILEKPVTIIKAINPIFLHSNKDKYILNLEAYLTNILYLNKGIIFGHLKSLAYQTNKQSFLSKEEINTIVAEVCKKRETSSIIKPYYTNKYQIIIFNPYKKFNKARAQQVIKEVYKNKANEINNARKTSIVFDKLESIISDWNFVQYGKINNKKLCAIGNIHNTTIVKEIYQDKITELIDARVKYLSNQTTFNKELTVKLVKKSTEEVVKLWNQHHPKKTNESIEESVTTEQEIEQSIIETKEVEKNISLEILEMQFESDKISQTYNFDDFEKTLFVNEYIPIYHTKKQNRYCYA